MHLKYPNILKQRFPTFGTVITVVDNEQDDFEIDSDYIYTCINIYMTYYTYMTYVYMYTYTYTYILHFLCKYTYYKYLHACHTVTSQMLHLYSFILTITNKDTFLWENDMILNTKIQGEGSRS